MTEINLYTREKEANKAYEHIKNRKVFIAGCGNVGSVVATILAESGIQDMIVVDMDEFSYVENRQLYSTEENMGVNKAIATAREIATRADCSVIPLQGNAINLLKANVVDIKGYDIFLCVDSVEARKEIFNAAIQTAKGRNNLGEIFDVGVQDSTIQVTNYFTKKPHDLYFDEGRAHCVTFPLASYRAFMAASFMVGAYFSIFEPKEKDDKPLVPHDKAIQLFTNTMMLMENPIFGQ